MTRLFTTFTALDVAAVEALIRAPGQDTKRGLRDTTIILLLFDTAARIQELLDLTGADIDTTAGRGRVTLTGKGRKTRTVPIMDKTGRHRDQYLRAFHPGGPGLLAPFFFTIRAGQRHPMSQDNISYMLNKHGSRPTPSSTGSPTTPERSTSARSTCADSATSKPAQTTTTGSSPSQVPAHGHQPGAVTNSPEHRYQGRWTTGTD